MQRRTFLSAVGVASIGAIAGCVGGIAGCVGGSEPASEGFEAASPAFGDDETLPRRFTCDGDGVSPPFELRNPPEPTASIMVQGVTIAGVANEATFWSLWNVPPDTQRIPASLPNEPEVPSLDGARQGQSRVGTVGYKPPCPDTQTTEYYFQAYALSERLDVDGGAPHERAVDATEGLVLASDRTDVTYGPER